MKKLALRFLLVMMLSIIVATPVIAQEVTLEVHTKFNPGEPFAKYYQEATELFEEENPDINVELNLLGRQVDAIARPRLIGGNPPDLIELHNPLVYRFYKDDLVMPIDKYLETPAYDSENKWNDDFNSLVIENAKIEGQLYHIPTYYSAAGFFYNKNMFEELDLKVPHTWDQFIEVLETLKANDIEPIGSDFNSNYLGWWFVNISNRILGPDYVQDTVLNKEGTSWKDPGYYEAAELLQTLRDNYFQEDFVGNKFPSAQVDWVNGISGLFYCGTWLPNEMSKQMPSDFKTDFFKFPEIEGGKGNKVLQVWDSGFVIPKKAENPEAAIKWLKFLFTEEVQQYLPERSLSPLKNASVHEDLSNVPEVINSADSLIDLRSGITTLASEWEVNVYQPVNDKFMMGELDAEGFIEELDKAHKKYYNK